MTQEKQPLEFTDSDARRWLLVLSGILTGLGINVVLTFFPINSLSLFRIFLIILGIISILWAIGLLKTEKRLKTIRKARLFFFGLSIASFGLAILDVVISIFLLNGKILVYNGFPYITIGSISFGSILISFALGGFFSVIERFLDLLERGDISIPFRG